MSTEMLMWVGDGGRFGYIKDGVRYLPCLHADWVILKEGENGHFDMIPIKMQTEEQMLSWFDAHNAYHARWGRYLGQGQYHTKTPEETAAYIPIQPAPNMRLISI